MTALLQKIGTVETIEKILHISPEESEYLIYAPAKDSLKEEIIFTKNEEDKFWLWNAVHGWYKSKMTFDQATRITGRHVHVLMTDLRKEYADYQASLV